MVVPVAQLVRDGKPLPAPLAVPVDRDDRALGCPDDPGFATFERPVADLSIDMIGDRFEVYLGRVADAQLLKQCFGRRRPHQVFPTS
jgi:hypothetical protein